MQGLQRPCESRLYGTRTDLDCNGSTWILSMDFVWLLVFTRNLKEKDANKFILLSVSKMEK